MLTLKFYRGTEGGRATHVVSCLHYSVFERDNGSIEIVTFQKPTTEDGICRNLSVDDGEHSQCYAENQAGKTIAHYVATREPKAAA